MLNIAIVSHGFRESAKAISKTARGCRRDTAVAAPVQHLAILPWPSDLPKIGTGNNPFQRIGSFAADNGGRLLRSAERADFAARTLFSAEYQVAR
jgi:hypothetical protein